ncbi:hypothetical protein LLEC1_02754 [Akanthomyces lecanii]|uniref:Uncharacterized protein n=1 Tax=Cordyceps confragosa TaxID=2714763 RepID=A0A179ITP9_CORDF|nr:hypothetical protein LLEC1_02754 [Akanthomyces lecanii]
MSKIETMRRSRSHLEIQTDDGQLSLSIAGYKTNQLLAGDVAFVPAGAPFRYRATLPFTKFLRLNASPHGLEYGLLNRSVSWGFSSYPVHGGFKAVA